MEKITNSAPYGVFINPRNTMENMKDIEIKDVNHMYPKLKRISTDDFKTSKKVGIYLAAYKAMHPKYAIVYQDINGKRDIGGDMMEVDLKPYDFIIATPPCNWWSRANWRRNTSEYSLKTKHLLIDIIDKLAKQEKPFIVENVRNDKFFKKYGLFDKGLKTYKIGRHTYWTNIDFKCDDIVQNPIVEIKDGKKILLVFSKLV